MATIYEVHFGLLNVGELPTEVSEIADDWETTFKGKRSKILSNLQRVIADESDYNDKIVDRSNTGYQDFLGSGHALLDEIMLKRKVKMPARASDYITNRNAAFQEGGAFESGITNNKSAFATNVKVTLRVVGDKDKIWGAVPKLRLCLAGKKTLLEEMLNDTYDHLITSNDLKAFFKSNRTIPAIVATVNKALTLIVYAIDAGYDDTWITNNIANAYNTELANYVNADMVNADLDAANCGITIEKDSTTGRWGVKVVEATP